MRKSTILGLFLFTSGYSGLLWADEQADIFTALDSNQDGFVTNDEVPEAKRQLLGRLLRANDKNGDGKLSKEEFIAKEAEAPKTVVGAGLGGGGGEKINAGEIISRFDKNADGKLSPEEAPERLKENFARVDSNGDGFVEKSEFESAIAAMQRGEAGGMRDPNAIFQKLDANQDGKLVVDEIPEEHREKFKEMLTRLGQDSVNREQFSLGFRLVSGEAGGPPGGALAGGSPFRGPILRALDSNGDNELSSEEIANAPAALKKLDRDGDGKISGPELAPPGGPGGPPPGATTNTPAGFNPQEMMLKRVKEMDKNGDGKIARDEASGLIAAGFDKADKNSDGSLEESEIRTAMEMVRERIREGGEKIKERLPGQKKPE